VTDQPESQTPQRLEDLQPKMKLTGTVKKIELFGAFVDVGVGRDGLVHISAMSKKPVTKVDDLVKVGDTVTVWVRRVDTQAGRIELSMVEPAGLDWSEIRSGQIYTGKVVKIERFGAFIEIGAERPGLIHISELATYRVENVNEIVKMGDTVEVKVIGVDARKRQIKLSMKALETTEVPEEENAADEPTLTAMQIALQRAMAGDKSEPAANSARPARNQKKQRDTQEDIMSRTLANKRK
jgi:transcriptional accessory protein Tex/SPT6